MGKPSYWGQSKESLIGAKSREEILMSSKIFATSSEIVY